MKKYWILSVAISIIILAVRVDAFTINLAQAGNPENLFGPAAGRYTISPDAPGGVIIARTVATVETAAIPVRGGQKYKLQIAAGVQGDFVVEKNERAHIMTLLSTNYQLASGYEVVFQDAEGKPVPGLANQTIRGFFLTAKVQLYTMVFHAPVGAHTAKVRFRPNGRGTQVAALRLLPETEEGTVNPNPDFRYGELNYSGWAPQRDGRMYQKPDGKVVMVSGYYAASSIFPLQQGRQYHIRGVGSAGRVALRYLNQQGREVSSRSLFQLTPNGVEIEISPPPDVVAGVFILVNTVIEELRVTEK